MTKRELIDYCLTYPTVYEDHPFDETTGEGIILDIALFTPLISEREVLSSKILFGT